LNGDGSTDFVNLLWQTGLHIFLGGTTPDTIPAYVWPDVPATLGTCGIVNDLNNDGKDELIITQDSVLSVHLGRDTLNETPDYNLIFACPTEALFNAGDVNGDSYNDFFAHYRQCAWNGLASLYLGHSWLNRYPILSITGETPPLDMPGVWRAVGLGDVNDDDIDDFGVGGSTNVTFGQRGKAVIVGGNPDWIVGADQPPIEIPAALDVSVYPNPFNSSTTVKLQVPPGKSNGQLRIYNVLGETVVQRQMSLSSRDLTLPFDGRSDSGSQLPSGIYILTVQFDDLVSSLKMVLIR